MFLAKSFLNLSMFLFLTNSNSEFLNKIGNIRVWNCTLVSRCVSQTPTPTPTPTPQPNNRKCRDGNRRFSEGEIIERHGIKLVCKNRRFVPIDT